MRLSVSATVFAQLFLFAALVFADMTVLLTRHGDRDPLGEGLNAKGRVRALALPDAVAGYDIAAIYAPDKPRNLATAAPLASRLGLPVTVLDPRKAAGILRDAFPGRAVIWIGNTDNLDSIYFDLGGADEPPEFFGDIYVLKLTAAGTAVEKFHYGD